MDDEFQDKLVYQMFVSHVKIFSKLLAGLSVNMNYFGYFWRMFRLYMLKPEVFCISVVLILFIAYIQNVNFRSSYFLQKIGIGESVNLKGIQFQSKSDNASWEYKAENVAVFAVQGRRPHMEDRFVVKENFKDSGVSLYAIFDGHGGDFAAEYAAENLINDLKSRVLEIKNIMKAGSLVQTAHYNKELPALEAKKTSRKPLKKMASQDETTVSGTVVDEDLKEIMDRFLPPIQRVTRLVGNTEARQMAPERSYVEGGRINYNKLITDQVLATDYTLVETAKKKLSIAGTTALIALIENNRLIVANVGDSRGVMCDSKGNAIPLSFDHKPQQMREKKRIEEAGGFISFSGVWRVAGVLATSRALGDYPLKERKLVIAEPDILTFDLADHRPQFLILASDGLWDAFSNEEAVAFVKERLRHEPLHGAKSITLQAYYKGSLDNITVIVINLSERSYQD